MSSPKIRVLLADDHKLFRAGIRALLATASDPPPKNHARLDQPTQSSRIESVSQPGLSLIGTWQSQMRSFTRRPLAGAGLEMSFSLKSTTPHVHPTIVLSIRVGRAPFL